ncbi:MAG TPA: sodium:proton antiporter [Polyangiaceae bacterium]|nr:sodium:proton antiporter [Polyangiaceae bacterium]
MSAPVESFPWWTTAPFPALVLAIAVLPIAIPHWWERRWFQILVSASCAAPVIAYCLANQQGQHLAHALSSYGSFVLTLTALYVTSGGIFLAGDIEATPAVNVCFLLVGSLLASVVGTTGASMLLIRPLLRTNRQREHRAHLVPFFILAVANAGGLLTPLGDPPLLVGYIEGVPFLWTLRLFPIWLLYVATFALALYVADRRAYQRESAAALAADRSEVVPLGLKGRRNVLLLLAIVPAAMLPAGWRELAMIAVAAVSYFATSRELHQESGFSFGPMSDVAIIFAGLFICLGPIEVALAQAAPHLPLRQGWQLFWASGLLSAVLDNAPTYTAFAALARGLTSSAHSLVAGISPIKLAAVSAGSVVMGATTYIGNGPNLMIKAIAEREHFPMPSFVRYAIFAFLTMLPVHLIVTVALIVLDR